MSNTILEYVWLGANNELRSKTKVVTGEYHLLQKCLYGLSMVLLQNKPQAIIQIAYLNQ